MGLSNPIWAILSFSLGILLVQHKPEYSVRESYFLTALSIFFTTLVGRIVYTTILYPEFFTPLRHIQTPKASIHTYIQLIIHFDLLEKVGTIIANLFITIYREDHGSKAIRNHYSSSLPDRAVSDGWRRCLMRNLSATI